MTSINIADGKRTPLQTITQDDKAGLSDFDVEVSLIGNSAQLEWEAKSSRFRYIIGL
jgi:hypothetical protein